MQFYYNSNFFQTTTVPQDQLLVDERKYLDPIHGYIGFDSNVWAVIDTPQFQRLRHIKQLGTTNLVFAGGTHTRFEHSIGVAFLAQKYMKKIHKLQPKLITSEEQRQNVQRNVTVAGLVHDIGHGPFSHLFEQVVHKFNTNWSHEQMSCEIFQNLVDDNHIDVFSHEDITQIKNLVKGDNPYKNHFQEQDLGWIFDIVANKRNSIDVDKFDYLLRDAYHIGFKDQSFDYKTIMKNSLVIEGEICYNAKMATKIYDLFQSRYRMFKQVYLNRIAVGMDIMIQDVLLNANNYYRFDEMASSVDSYLTLTDTILQNIEHSTDPTLQKSRDIIKKIKRRDIYKFVNEIIISSQQSMDTTDRMKQDISSYSDQLTVEDIDIYIGQANYGKKDQNPVDNVKFYKKPNYQNSFHLRKDQVSLLLPSSFSEKFLRLYVKNIEKVEPANKAFVAYCNRHFNQELININQENPQSFNHYFKQRSLTNTPVKKTKLQ